MSQTTEQYHLAELEIAHSPADPRRSLPEIPPTCRRILDVGCGAGQTLIASRLREQTVSYGMDLDWSALNLGRTLTQRVHFVLARGEQIPFRDNSFDMLICRAALPQMQIRAALVEMARVLRPGGDIWLVLHSFSMVASRLVEGLRSWNVAAVLNSCQAIANGMMFSLAGRQIRVPGMQADSYQTAASITNALQQSGYHRIEIRRRPHFIVQAKKRP